VALYVLVAFQVTSAKTIPRVKHCQPELVYGKLTRLLDDYFSKTDCLNPFHLYSTLYDSDN